MKCAHMTDIPIDSLYAEGLQPGVDIGVKIDHHDLIFELTLRRRLIFIQFLNLADKRNSHPEKPEKANILADLVCEGLVCGSDVFKIDLGQPAAYGLLDGIALFNHLRRREGGDDVDFMSDQQFRRLLDFLGLSWNGYRRVRKGVKKRIGKHMQKIKIDSLEGLLRAMESAPHLKEEVGRLMTVPISRFFRDRRLWQVLEDRLIPQILVNEKKKMKVWSAGCARGEEVYSFKIIWEKMRGRVKEVPELELWGTDINPSYLEKARQGIYAASSLKALSLRDQSNFFHALPGNLFAVVDSLKDGVLWQPHNLLTDLPPASGFSIIFLRNNLLTYYENKFLAPAFEKVVEALRPRGFLIIGARENLPGGFQTLRPSSQHPNIFRKIDGGPAINHEKIGTIP